MPKFTILAQELRRLPQWWKVDILVRMRPLHLTEVEQEEERCLEAMSHWHDPDERLRRFCCRAHAHTLVDDNPASG
jgi:hypothetical protein